MASAVVGNWRVAAPPPPPPTAVCVTACVLFIVVFIVVFGVVFGVFIIVECTWRNLDAVEENFLGASSEAALCCRVGSIRQGTAEPTHIAENLNAATPLSQPGKVQGSPFPCRSPGLLRAQPGTLQKARPRLLEIRFSQSTTLFAMTSHLYTHSLFSIIRSSEEVKRNVARL
jgi:hypothetical protein